MAGMVLLELKRALRDARYLIIGIGMPVGLYLLFTGLFGSHGQRAQGLPQPVELMVAMIVYGGMWAALSSTGPRIAHERAIGWSRQLRMTPIAGGTVIAAKVISAVAVTLPAMIVVALVAFVSHNISLDPTRWLLLLACMWAAMLPLALLGFALGYLLGSEVAFPVTMGIYFALGALGGLWMPLSMLPQAMRDVAHGLPTYGAADIGWNIAAGKAPPLSSLTLLILWTAGCGAVGLAAYRLAAQHEPG